MNFNNTILLSADRNGSTAYQREITNVGLNQDYFVWLGECFSQTAAKNQPPEWYDPKNHPPKHVIDTINRGTGKSVFLKIQLTWPVFDESFLEIPAARKIFLFRNLFDSNLSRCVALLTGRWFSFENDNTEISQITVPEDYFIERLEYRIDKYEKHIDKVLNWSNECVRYENIKYKNIHTETIPNPDKKLVVTNYKKLKEIYDSYGQIQHIEDKVNNKIVNGRY